LKKTQHRILRNDRAGRIRENREVSLVCELSGRVHT